MSMLTLEERKFLKAIGCRNKEHAVHVLVKIALELPVRSEMFNTAVSLISKLKCSDFDFTNEMSI